MAGRIDVSPDHGGSGACAVRGGEPCPRACLLRTIGHLRAQVRAADASAAYLASLTSPPAPVEGEREEPPLNLAWEARDVLLDIEAAHGRVLDPDLRETIKREVAAALYREHKRTRLASHPVQGAGGGERETPTWPRGYTVRIAVEALEGVSVCASLSEQDPDGAWVVMREVTECPTVDAALRALASWEPAPLPQRMECPYCLAVWRPVSVADAECCPSCLRDLPPLASPAPSVCPCRRCVEERERDIPLWERLPSFIVCVTCGNKRCPHATDHQHACTGSNEPGQPGSVFGGLASPAPSAGGTHYCPVCRHPVLLRAPDGTCGDPECRLAASPAPSAPEEEP